MSKKNLFGLRVAKVLTEYHVVLNAGWEDEVSPGMQFVVFSVGEEIKDPDTGASLGLLEYVKGTVEVEHVQPRMCVCISTIRGNALINIASGGRPKLQNVQEGDYARRTT